MKNIIHIKDAMTSKERVLRTFAREKTDRVPIDYYGNAGIDKRMMDYFGAKDLEGLHVALGTDFRRAIAPYIGPRLHSVLPDRNVDPEWGVVTRWIEHSSGGYWDFCDFPLIDADEEKVAAYPMPNPDNYDYEAAFEYCKVFRDKALHVGDAGLVDIINADTRLRSMEQILVDLMTDDPAGLLLIDRRLDVEFEVTARIVEKCKDYLSFMWTGEDLGTQNAPIISRNLFQKHIRPRHQRFIDLAKAYGLPVMMHSCGASSWVYPDFIEMGIAAVDTLQPEAKSMSPQYLKENFGDKLAFHGCISTGWPLAFGTVDDVVTNVRETLDIMKPGGGYMLSPTHWIQDNSPTENIVALYEAAHKYGKY